MAVVHRDTSKIEKEIERLQELGNKIIHLLLVINWQGVIVSNKWI